MIGPESPLHLIVSETARTRDEIERMKVRGAHVMTYPSEELMAYKLRDLLARGFKVDNIGWHKVSQTFFVLLME